MSKVHGIPSTKVLFICSLLLLVSATSLTRALSIGIGVGVNVNWSAGVSGNFSNPLMWNGGLLPGLLTANTIINAQGSFLANITASTILNGGLTIGGPGSNPTVNVAAGVVLTINGPISIQSGSLTISAGGSIIANGGVMVTATVPVVINLNGSIALNILQVSAALGANVNVGLTINGNANLSLAGVLVTLTNTNLMLNVPVSVGLTTVISAIGNANVMIGAGLSVGAGGIGSVSLLAPITVMTGATLNLNVALTLLRLTVQTGTTTVINAGATIGPALNILGSLTIGAGANLAINGMMMSSVNVALSTGLSGNFNLITSGLALQTSATAIVAVRTM